MRRNEKRAGRSELVFTSFPALFLVSAHDGPPYSLFFTEHYPSLRKIVGGHFQGDIVAGQDTDEVHPHFAGNVGIDHMAGLDFHSEHGIGQELLYHTFNSDYIIFCHVNISGSFSVIKIICS